jgi:hypothetical protein
LVIDRAAEDESAPARSTDTIAALVAELESEGLDHRAALKKVARSQGISRDEAYRRLVAERNRGA